MATEENGSVAPPGHGQRAADISNMMVRLLQQYTGRGPTRARTRIHDDLVTCVMQDTLTKGERSLVDRGQGETVLETRKLYQHLMREDAIRGVEEILRRRVAAFLSDNHIDPDLAVETWVLASEE
jgi:uncharacterized protein YbcI